MARAATVGYTRPVGESLQSPIKPTKVKGSVGRFLGETPPPTKTDVLNAAQMARTRQNSPMARLERRVRDTQHNNDMYRIGGGPVNVIGRDNTRFGRIQQPNTNPRRQYNRGRNLRAPVIDVDRPRIGFVRGPDGKIVSERKAQTLAASEPVNRPFGKPAPAPGISVRGASGGFERNPAYAAWKEHAVSYNQALSRQQALHPDNYRLQAIGAQAGGSLTEAYPGPINYAPRSEVDRGGAMGNLRPQPSLAAGVQKL